MSAINVSCLLAIACTLAVVLEAMPQKGNYENLDVDAIIKDKNVLNSFVQCLKNLGECTPEEQDLKDNTHKNLETTCADCTAKQKAVVRKTGRFMLQNYPEEWEILVKQYDSEKKYIAKFIEFMNRDD